MTNCKVLNILFESYLKKLTDLGKLHPKKKRKKSDNVTPPPPLLQLVTAWGCEADHDLARRGARLAKLSIPE